MVDETFKFIYISDSIPNKLVDILPNTLVHLLRKSRILRKTEKKLVLFSNNVGYLSDKITTLIEKYLNNFLVTRRLLQKIEELIAEVFLPLLNGQLNFFSIDFRIWIFTSIRQLWR